MRAFCPIVNVSPDVRYPVMGATLQRRGGVARHDKVAWALRARAPTDLGVDIVEHAEVTGFVRGAGGAVEGVETTRGTIRATKVALAAAGHTSVLAVDGWACACRCSPTRSRRSSPRSTSRS